MVLVYLLEFFWRYVIPVILLVLIAVAIRKIIFRNLPLLGWVVGISIALGIAGIAAIKDQHKLRYDLNILAESEITPNGLDLPAGALLHLHDGNQAGVTCRSECPFRDLPFVTSVHVQEQRYAFQLEHSDDVLTRHDLWHLVPDADRTQPFPYSYAFISVPYYNVMHYEEAQRNWPHSVKAAHMLVEIPADGVFDFKNANIHYQRFNVQMDIATFPFMGFNQETQQVPSVGEIFQDLKNTLR